MTDYPRFLACGDTALSVEFGDRVDPHLSGLVLALNRRLAAARVPGVVEAVPTFRALMVHYDPLATSHGQVRAALEALMRDLEAVEAGGRLWTLPVCYEGDLAPDLAEVAERTELKPDDVIACHASVTYRVYMIGFLPGYPYMGQLPKELYLPRRENPRIKVPMGSVSIAVDQTSIYSFESPGGWHLIGRTPVRLFDPRRDDWALLEPGDRVRFEPIPRERFATLDEQAAAGSLHLAPQGHA
jgi:KipI family sensor histidine kinase inhibitor